MSTTGADGTGPSEASEADHPDGSILRSLIDVSPSGIGLVRMNDDRHVVRHANRALAALFGCSAEAAVGRALEDLLVGTDAAPPPPGPGWHEFHCRTSAGMRWTRWYLSPVADRDLLMVQIDDIHERVLARQQAQLQARLLELIPEPVIVRELDGTIRYWNAGAAEVYGHDGDMVRGRRTHDLLSTRFVGADLAEVERQLATAGVWRGMLEHRHADGRLLRMMSKHVRDDLADGQPVVLEVNVDVTNRYAAEQALAASEAKFRSQFLDSTVGQLIRRPDGTVEEVNQTFADMVGRRPVDLVGTRADALFGPSDAHVDPTAVGRLVAGDVDELSGEGTLVRPDGTLVDVTVNLSAARAPDGTVERVIGVFHDITARKIADKALTHQAFHDPLTGLANRALLLARVARALADAADGGRAVGLLYLDLDGFKDVNDTCGHLTGDALLIEVAQRLRECVRSEDTVARLGGDEFVVLVPELAPPGRLHAIAERVLSLLAAPYEIGAHRIDTVTASIGISQPMPNADPDDVLSAADRAMYAAKRSGKNRISAAPPG